MTFTRIVLLAVALLAGRVRAAVPDKVDYARDVLPILSDACYHCHGPDEKARKASLRFDTREGAFRLKDGKSVIVPGKATESELVRRINSKDPDEMMPPDDGVRKLSADQVNTLTKWVEQGAAWGVHWAFIAPKREDEPKSATNPSWSRNFIDGYVLARLEKEKLNPSAEADRSTLIRRVTFDLTGLPPTPAEVDAFVNDTAPNAYEKVVDRLLASPRYGERMAVDWLDLARFADTHGYQFDRERPTWPYRDWVIKAFNENLPFDQFAIWQLAGDLLPKPTKEQRLATAFNRLHMQNEEGGIVEEEFRVAYVIDRVTTMGTAFLGLTFECSRCHDHKYDPITQRDFYSLFSMFQNIDESGQTSYFTGSTPVPTMLLSTAEQDAKLAELNALIAAKVKQLSERRSDLATAQAFDKWLALRGNTPPAQLPGLTAAYDFDEIKDGKIANRVDAAYPGKAVENPTIVSDNGTVAKLGGDNGFTFKDIGTFSRADAFSIGICIQPSELSPRQVVVHHSRAPIDAGSRGYELLLENGHVAFGLHHMWPGNALKVVTRRAVEVNDRTHVVVTYDGSSKAAGVRIYLDGEPAELNVVRDGLWKEILYDGGEPETAVGFRFRDSGFRGGFVDDFQIYNRALTPLEAAQLAGKANLASAWATHADQLSVNDRAGLFDYYFANVDPTARKLDNELNKLRRAQSTTINPIPEMMVMKEMDHPKPAFILKRGAYDAPGEPVSADTPHFLPPLKPGQPHNRLGLARWLTSPENPLTARVTVNRFWQQMFGRGIVETSDNFGKQGAQPTHPELLDALARSFVDDMHWDVKRLLKTIAMSATYRQSSKASPELLQLDIANHLLARGPAQRLSAEMLRDQALSLSGLLVEQLGGPSVRPYQPDGLWDVAMGRPQYGQGHGPDLYRRSMYTFWKRTVPPPAMVAFDAADRSYCTARRQSTSTPLQALVLLNDPQVVEAARFISQRTLKEGGSNPEQRLAWVFRLILGRPASEKELVVLKQMWAEQRELLSSDSQASAKLLTVGESKTDPSLDKNDVAAGTVIALALLNHDGAVMRR
jgi:hypothetical protein